MALFALTLRAQLKRRLQHLHLHSRQHSILPHQFIRPPIRTHRRLQRLHAKLKSSSSTTSLQNIHAHTISRGSLCANVYKARRRSACIGNCQRDQHQLKINARPWLCVNKVPPTMELAGISRIDPVVGMENWEIRI